MFEWEKDGSFHPETIQRRVLPTRFVDLNGDRVKEESTYWRGQQDFVDRALKENMCFLDPAYFIAGNVHNNSDLWEKIFSDNQSEALDWIKNRVDINKFMTHFKGEFNGIYYDHSYPPPRVFRNSPSCKQFVEFINSELTERLRSVAISHVGKVGEVDPPPPFCDLWDCHCALKTALMYQFNVYQLFYEGNPFYVGLIDGHSEDC